ncbi:G-type lectin S-receptor-like serine/threonine-protein kinase At1g11410 isoform X2 [Papaver somniferum]|nr:G-type lectin S-receptor-like serine/threonine-protein kinase At1g11410 isoform X2 [Papaver somniferum]XP_026425748.1 G-type lectin S-receptor-like serine/threonine-protein kinase At1g11410 isoform X2 [Papaver somniferum]
MMGFFTPGESRNYYIGIWYNYDRVSVQTVVWVANRDKPLTGPASSELKLLANGNLVLYGPSNSSIWSTNSTSGTSNTTEAVLGGDGNFVLRDKRNPSIVFWQSFDYPTDTWLPGGKIGLNKKVGVNKLLTSWRNQEDPATGMFNLELDPTGINQYLIRWNKSIQVWTSGEWIEREKYFTLIPQMRGNYIYNFSYTSNENESYVTYNLYNKSIVVRMVMDVSGLMKQFTWSNTAGKWILYWTQPKHFCDVYGVCGPFGNCNQDTLKCECLPGFVERSPSDWNLRDSSGGCLRNTSLQCGSKDIGFSPIPSSKLPDNSQSRQVNSAEECKSACQSVCACNAYAYEKTQCQLWQGDMMNISQQSDGRAGNLYLKRADSEFLTEVRTRKVVIWKIIVPVIASLVAIIMGVFGYMYLCKRNKANERGRLKGLQGVWKTNTTDNETPNRNMFNDGKSEGESHELQMFSLASLTVATNDYCMENKLGEGGFGPVYKGKLENGQQIAVKRLSKSSGQGIEEFKNEVVLISKLQHRNLVKLLGCCVEGEENMLIYEFMPNKSLDAFLFDPRKKSCLDWDRRFDIIGGIARGLLYLHRDSRLRVIHRDLKVSNILLDGDMIPKISDFGMARIFGGNQTIDNTNRVVGTFGYMSPEYVMGGTFSEKSDVFSFGVLVLEVVSGKRNNSFYSPEHPLNLLLHAWSLWNEGKWSDIVDDDLGDLDSPNEVMKCIHIGLLCCQNRAVDRPTMAEVDLMLNYETDRPSPKEPPYTVPTFSDKPGNSSSNNVTLTRIEGR